jgi:hypothetical protein
MPPSARAASWFPCLAGAFVLKVKVERSIRVGLEGKVTADRETIEHVRYLKAFTTLFRLRWQARCDRRLGWNSAEFGCFTTASA